MLAVPLQEQVQVNGKPFDDSGLQIKSVARQLTLDQR
jgi:hypothetical protein